MKPSLSSAAASSVNVMRNACEALAHIGLKSEIPSFKTAFLAARSDSEKKAVLQQWFDVQEAVKIEPVLVENTLFAVLQRLSKVFYFWSRNAQRPASNTDLRSWIEGGHVEINGYVCTDPKEVIDFPVVSMVLFKGAKTQLTLF